MVVDVQPVWRKRGLRGGLKYVQERLLAQVEVDGLWDTMGRGAQRWLGFHVVQNLGRQALSRWNAGLWPAWASPESCPPVTSCFPLLWVPSLCPKPRRRPTLTSRASQLGYPGPEAAATGSWVG